MVKKNTKDSRSIASLDVDADADIDENSIKKKPRVADSVDVSPKNTKRVKGSNIEGEGSRLKKVDSTTNLAVSTNRNNRNSSQEPTQSQSDLQPVRRAGILGKSPSVKALHQGSSTESKARLQSLEGSTIIEETPLDEQNNADAINQSH